MEIKKADGGQDTADKISGNSRYATDRAAGTTDHSLKTRFERAIFLSWYCARGDCKFCYMSTQKNLINDPRKARRRMESIFAEAIISDACGWGIEFVSGGYESFSDEELIFIVRNISQLTQRKLWLNLGSMTRKQLEGFEPYIAGFAGTVECVNWKLREDLCPSKPIQPILDTYKACDSIGLKKAMTLIIGLGESIDDHPQLCLFIRRYGIDRITFYALNPQKGTPFESSPKIDYYESWIRKTRAMFPAIEIIAGAWHDKTEYFSRLLMAGAGSITKFPAIKFFGSEKARHIEEEVSKAGRKFSGSLTRLPTIDVDSYLDRTLLDIQMRSKTKDMVKRYMDKMQAGQPR